MLSNDMRSVMLISKVFSLIGSKLCAPLNHDSVAHFWKILLMDLSAAK